MCILTCLSLQVTSQHIPDLINYKTSEYKAHNQNWSVSQSADRWLYFANTEGLLSYNGNQWTKHSLDNKIIRAVHCHGDRIYTGAYGEFGYWLRDNCGDHHYTSLISLLPDQAISKEEIWHIISDGDDIYFQSFSLLFKFDGKKITKIELPNSIMFLQIVNGKKIVHSLSLGLFEITDTGYEKLLGSQFFADKIVTSVIGIPNTKDELLVTTSTHGVFLYQNGKIKPWSTSYQNFLIESQINKCIITKENAVIIGTIRDGLLIFNINGTLNYHIKSSNGLQNNTILSALQDVDGNLWVGLDKGISHIKMNEDILYFKDLSGNLGTVYCMLSDKDFLYVGTNQGLYYYHKAESSQKHQISEFRLVKGTQGQVWELKKFGNTILCGHNEGTYSIDKHQAYKISDVTGGWYLKQLKNAENLLVQGTYTGLIIFTKNGDTWKFSHKIDGFHEPVKKIIQKNNNQCWVTGPNLGLSLLTFDENWTKVIKIEKYGATEGLTFQENPDINIQNDTLLLYDGKTHFYYDEAKRLFIQTTKSTQGNSDYFTRQVGDNLWARIYKDSLIILQGKIKYKYNVSVNKDYHSLNLLGDDILGICLNEGYAVVKLNNIDQSQHSNKSPIKILSVFLNRQNVCLPYETTPIKINHNDNDFKIIFYDTEYISDKQYWYRISSIDSEWRPVNRQDFLTLSNLPTGYQMIELKTEDHTTEMRLHILPPWYRSTLAFVFYFLLSFFLLLYIKKYFDRKLEIQTKKLNAENERRLREQKIAMENDRLQQENLTKSKELANSTMHLIQKNELLQEIKEELIQIRKSGDQILTTKDFQIMMKQINDNLTVQEDKKLFSESFDDVHADFLQLLKAQYPELTGDDLKLAAYLRMELSSKDIAPLFNISMRGLENKRYRLRKKIGLSNEVNLTEFFKDMGKK